ncbi:hypothetical protein [Microlunatus antarcticus]|jgi:hypothetical protein|uniref:Uncharacterized protein n=1 Tax=Microlunatus antarcticus TaxID=53388 RepID=A0A7W5JVB4_9ACTN|nr:hypothetical protein [Microlunatus antarcticus]MBB3327015.1 hypothetical protein [Microlunatus antarcticus]
MAKQRLPASSARSAVPTPGAVLRLELSEAHRILDRAEAALTAMEAAKREPGSITSVRRPERYYQLLVDVYERGRHGVPAEVFAALGRERGYDARGLGGFFVGGRAPLRRPPTRATALTAGSASAEPADAHVAAGVQLSAEGHRLLDRYLNDAS